MNPKISCQGKLWNTVLTCESLGVQTTAVGSNLATPRTTLGTLCSAGDLPAPPLLGSLWATGEPVDSESCNNTSPVATVQQALHARGSHVHACGWTVNTASPRSVAMSQHVLGSCSPEAYPGRVLGPRPWIPPALPSLWVDWRGFPSLLASLGQALFLPKN